MADQQPTIDKAFAHLSDVVNAIRKGRDEANAALALARQVPYHVGKLREVAKKAAEMEIPDTAEAAIVESVQAFGLALLEVFSREEFQAILKAAEEPTPQRGGGKVPTRRRRRSSQVRGRGGKKRGKQSRFRVTREAEDILRKGSSAQTLEEALQIAYGADWTQKTIRVFKKGGGIENVPLGEDINVQDSRLRRWLAEAVNRLGHVHNNTAPQGYSGPTPQMSRLYQDLTREGTIEAISGVVASWGVNIDRAAA